jgi:hypothetical protein
MRARARNHLKISTLPGNIANTYMSSAPSRIAYPAVLANKGRQVAPLYTPEDFLDSCAGTLPAINRPQVISLTVRHFGRGHKDQLPGNYASAPTMEREAKFFNDFSRACVRVRARERVTVAPAWRHGT